MSKRSDTHTWVRSSRIAQYTGESRVCLNCGRTPKNSQNVCSGGEVLEAVTPKIASPVVRPKPTFRDEVLTAAVSMTNPLSFGDAARMIRKMEEERGITLDIVERFKLAEEARKVSRK